MSPRALKIALAASVALNLFAVAAGVTVWARGEQVERRLEREQAAPRQQPFDAVLARLEPTDRDRVRQRLRGAAEAARPDFQQARALRREAIATAEGATYDQPRIVDLLRRSREAEARGRERLETEAADLLSTLSVEDRKALAPLLQPRRRGGGNGNNGGEGPRAERPSR